jgi:hypothetical protein
MNVASRPISIDPLLPWNVLLERNCERNATLLRFSYFCT